MSLTITQAHSNIPQTEISARQCLQIALAGQPNVGKSTVFHMLTGMTQHVGNWPGKTVEQKTGSTLYNGIVMDFVDLPGTYSLTSDSIEERIARDFIIKEKPDVVVTIVNAASLERDLYLLSELLWLPVPVVLGLNMMDVASQQGVRIEPHVLKAALGIPVVPMTASRGIGIRELLDAIARLMQDPASWNPKRPEIREDHQVILEQVECLIKPFVQAPYPCDWTAIKLLEGDLEVTQRVQASMGEGWDQVHEILMQHEDAILAIACGRYEWIGRMIRAAVIQPKAGQITRTDKIDRIATHPFWGLLTLLGILGGVFWLTYAIGIPLQNWLDAILVQAGSEWALKQLAGTPVWLQGMVVHGAIAGVGTVLTLLPILLIFFMVMGLLEDIGYMTRAAYVMDRFMHRMGLHGKSFIPLFMGFGCNVPAVMGARIIETPKARLVTILISPLVPCTARLAVLAILTPIFFGKNALWASLSVISLSLITMMGLGVALNKWFLGGERKAFIMEMPLYHLPNLHTIGLYVWQKGIFFLRTAGSTILVMSIFLWALSTYPGGRIDTSYMATAGHWLSPLGNLMGLDWRMLVALISSFMRKENTIPTLAILYGVGGQAGGLASALSGTLTPAAALAFLVVQTLFVPCLATVAAIRQETGSWHWTTVCIVLILGVSLVGGITVYHLVNLFHWVI